MAESLFLSCDVQQVVSHRRSRCLSDCSRTVGSCSKNWRSTALEWQWRRRLVNKERHTLTLSWTLLHRAVLVASVHCLVCPRKLCSLSHALIGPMLTEFSPISSSVRLSLIHLHYNTYCRCNMSSLMTALQDVPEKNAQSLPCNWFWTVCLRIALFAWTCAAETAVNR